VPEDLLDDANVHSLLEEEGGGGVPSLMKPSVRNPGIDQ
jgi:hypothetical protein